jgi:hypothetical protein
VQQDKLANLFEMVAEALRQKSVTSDSSSGTSGKTTNDSAPSSSEGTEANQQVVEEYATMTLPCASVISARTCSDSSEENGEANPLYMTVSLRLHCLVDWLAVQVSNGAYL